ncbi:hypothetical protein KIN20_026667 [Parelaphostrongylus tenuis]|uniref:Uncharacterized protein n=1 Tax=Parelaphostrongylus tenuis TaxID=148309 RepID=A0AAD5WCY4_PARTN|nr:hypothetical protein KIN20_026667 [Parelaphostrongylus tenuis]
MDICCDGSLDCHLLLRHAGRISIFAVGQASPKLRKKEAAFRTYVEICDISGSDRQNRFVMV